MTAERGSSQARWQHQFSEVDREITKMASICGVDMLDRTQLRRTLENDSSMCSHTNQVAFAKLHRMLKAHYLLRERAAGAIGDRGRSRRSRSRGRTCGEVQRGEQREGAAMIDAELFREEGVLTVFPTGALTDATSPRWRDWPIRSSRPHGGLNGLMIVAEHFPGWESFAALTTHIRFVRRPRTAHPQRRRGQRFAAAGAAAGAGAPLRAGRGPPLSV